MEALSFPVVLPCSRTILVRHRNVSIIYLILIDQKTEQTKLKKKKIFEESRVSCWGHMTDDDFNIAWEGDKTKNGHTLFGWSPIEYRQMVRF